MLELGFEAGGFRFRPHSGTLNPETYPKIGDWESVVCVGIVIFFLWGLGPCLEVESKGLGVYTLNPEP